MIVLDRARGSTKCDVYRLLPIIEEVFLLQHRFNYISFTRVCREHNGVDGRISKEAVQLLFGCWKILEQDLAGSYSYYHGLFNEEQVLVVLDRD